MGLKAGRRGLPKSAHFSPPLRNKPKRGSLEGGRAQFQTTGGSSPSPLGFSAACQALIAPREVSGRAGQALSLHCWYAPGYEAYNKYWCRGASRDSCRKVVETAGREVPRQRGRVSITDNHVFCLVLLTLEELSEEDAGSYWCGVERAGRDIMKPVTIRVLPGECWHPDGVL
nr:CMRF35-like molecule 2 [Anser cygnoides]